MTMSSEGRSWHIIMCMQKFLEKNNFKMSIHFPGFKKKVEDICTHLILFGFGYKDSQT